MHVLRANNLAKAYGENQVVRDISLEVHSGQVVGLLGPNGAGKTTSFYMIVGSVSQDKGTVEIDDLDVTSLPVHERARKGIGYLPQEASVFRKLTVAENLLAILETRRDLNKTQQNSKAEQLMSEFRISDIRNSLRTIRRL